MKTFSMLLIIFLISISSALAQDTLVFASYNVENLFDLNDNPQKWDDEFLPEGKKEWTTDRYTDKLEKLAIVINDLNADILGLVEVENRLVLDDLVRQSSISDRDYRVIHEDSPDARGIDVAILYDSKRFRYLWHSVHGIHFPFSDSFSTRDILFAAGVVGNSDTLVIFMNHWPSRIRGKAESEKYRVFVASELKTLVDSLYVLHPEYHVIISGDFNDTPNDTSVSEILQAMNSVNNLETDDLFNTSKYFNENTGTYLFRGAWYQYDQIIVSASLLSSSSFRLLGESVEIFSRPYLFEQEGKYKGYMLRTYAGRKYLGGYSDHLPVRAKFKISHK